MATVEAAREIMKEACKRAAKLWELPEDAVEYVGRRRAARRPQRRQARADDAEGHRRHRRQDRRARSPATRASTRTARHRASPRTSPTSRSTRRPAGVWVVRYTAIQDAGRAIHPSYVEGQYQGGVAQGIGWALNEEYIYGARRQAAERGLPRLPRAGGLRPADDRHGDRRGAEPAPSLRRARRRRDADRAADGRHRQRGAPTPPACASPTCRCRRPRCWPRSTRPERRARRRSEACARPISPPLDGEGLGVGGSRKRRVERSTPHPRPSPHKGEGAAERRTRPMAHVTLIGNLRQFTGGVTALDVDAANVRQLFARLGEKYPDAGAAPGDGLGGRHRRPDLPGRPVPGDRPRQRGAHPPADRGGLSARAEGLFDGTRSRSLRTPCCLQPPNKMPAAGSPSVALGTRSIRADDNGNRDARTITSLSRPGIALALPGRLSMFGAKRRSLRGKGLDVELTMVPFICMPSYEPKHTGGRSASIRSGRCLVRRPRCATWDFRISCRQHRRASLRADLRHQLTGAFCGPQEPCRATTGPGAPARAQVRRGPYFPHIIRLMGLAGFTPGPGGDRGRNGAARYYQDMEAGLADPRVCSRAGPTPTADIAFYMAQLFGERMARRNDGSTPRLLQWRTRIMARPAVCAPRLPRGQLAAYLASQRRPLPAFLAHLAPVGGQAAA